MPRKTENPRVLERLSQSDSSPDRRKVLETATAGQTPNAQALRGNKLETAILVGVNALKDMVLKDLPGAADNMNSALAELKFWKFMKSLTDAKAEAFQKELVAEEIIKSPSANQEPGQHLLGSSSGFEVVAIVSNPRASFSVDWLAAELKKSHKVPEHTTKMLCDKAKQPIGAKQVTVKVNEKSEAQIAREGGQSKQRVEKRTKAVKRGVATAILLAFCVSHTPMPAAAQSAFTFLRWEDVKPTHERLQRNKRQSRSKIIQNPTVSRVNGPAAAFVQPRQIAAPMAQ